jgi:hypothetical protein
MVLVRELEQDLEEVKAEEQGSEQVKEQGLEEERVKVLERELVQGQAQD